MRQESIPSKAPKADYWQRRVIDAEGQLRKAPSQEIRTVYEQLLQHYRRMANLCAAGPTSNVHERTLRNYNRKPPNILKSINTFGSEA